MKDLSKLRDEIPEKYPFMKDIGLECDDGWMKLIINLCSYLNVHWEDDFRVLQVKEKFGELRFYVNANDAIYDYIEKAEKLSKHICEVCGVISDQHMTRQMGNYWIKTICEKCYTEWENKNKY